MEKEKPKPAKGGAIQNEKNSTAEMNDIPVCNYAPEWSEHARFDRADEPCDDGRMGSRPCAEGKEGEACPVTDDRMSNDIKKPG